MKCPKCDKDHLSSDPCYAKMPDGFIGISVDLCKINKLVSWVNKKVKRWKTS